MPWTDCWQATSTRVTSPTPTNSAARPGRVLPPPLGPRSSTGLLSPELAGLAVALACAAAALAFLPAGPCRARPSCPLCAIPRSTRAAPDRLSGCRSPADDRSACSPGQDTSNPRLSRKPDNGQAGQRNHGIKRDDNAPLLTNSASSANPPRQSVHRYSEIPNSRTSAQNAQFGTAQRSSEMNCTSVQSGGYLRAGCKPAPVTVRNPLSDAA